MTQKLFYDNYFLSFNFVHKYLAFFLLEHHLTLKAEARTIFSENQ